MSLRQSDHADAARLDRLGEEVPQLIVSPPVWLMRLGRLRCLDVAYRKGALACATA